MDTYGYVHVYIYTLINVNLVKSEPSPSTASSGTLTTSRPAGSCDVDAWLDSWVTDMMKYDPLWMESCFSNMYLYMFVKLINVLQTLWPSKSHGRGCMLTTVADWDRLRARELLPVC